MRTINLYKSEGDMTIQTSYSHARAHLALLLDQVADEGITTFDLRRPTLRHQRERGAPAGEGFADQRLADQVVFHGAVDVYLDDFARGHAAHARD